MSVRASFVSAVVLSLGLTCSAQYGPQLNSSRLGIPSNSGMAREGTVSGSVRSFDDHAVADARVEVRSPSGDVLASAYSDARGMFNIPGLPSGNYEVVAEKGVNEGHDRVQVAGMDTQVTLRIAMQTAAPDGSTSVSVAQFRVPENARKIFLKAENAMKKNKLDDAKKYVAKALETYPEYAQALTMRGILEMNDGLKDQGIADFEHAIKADPSFALAYTTLGAVYNQFGHYADASRTLLRAVALDPKAWQGFYELAKSSLGQGDYKGALGYVSKASEISQEYAPIHLVKAHALLGLKMYQDAVGELELYLSREPAGANSDVARKTLMSAKAFVNSTTAQNQK
jgi:Flp pilus assembly protein TadD